MKLVLIGLRGTGKSTVGSLLADRLEWPFCDTDTLVQERAGVTIRELFERQGEAGFRQLESAVVKECSEQDQVVMASGGGAILDSENVTAMKRNGFVVHLTADPEELWRRICEDTSSYATRPQLVTGTLHGAEELRALMLSRAAAYASARDVEVSVENRTPDEVAEAVLILMRARGMMKQD